MSSNHDNCPRCAELFVVRDNCIRQCSMCPDGHQWHTCTKHDKVVEGHTKHDLADTSCTCKEF